MSIPAPTTRPSMSDADKIRVALLSTLLGPAAVGGAIGLTGGALSGSPARGAFKGVGTGLGITGGGLAGSILAHQLGLNPTVGTLGGAALGGILGNKWTGSVVDEKKEKRAAWLGNGTTRIGRPGATPQPYYNNLPQPTPSPLPGIPSTSPTPTPDITPGAPTAPSPTPPATVTPSSPAMAGGNATRHLMPPSLGLNVPSSPLMPAGPTPPPAPAAPSNATRHLMPPSLGLTVPNSPAAPVAEPPVNPLVPSLSLQPGAQGAMLPEVSLPPVPTGGPAAPAAPAIPDGATTRHLMPGAMGLTAPGSPLMPQAPAPQQIRAADVMNNTQALAQFRRAHGTPFNPLSRMDREKMSELLGIRVRPNNPLVP